MFAVGGERCGSAQEAKSILESGGDICYRKDSNASYRRTLVLALAALYEGPYLPDSQPRDEVRPGLRSLHVARKGRRSRHFILYPTRDAERIEVVRILHDSMDIVAISHPESTGGVRSPRASFL